MNRRAMEQLRLDRRLLRRQGWVSPEDLERELTTLPDVSDKIAAQPDEGASDAAPAPNGREGSGGT